MIKVLNLYTGIGGNRKLWPSDKIDVTAVELDEKIAKIYSDFFPNDKMIITDAHDYLLNHYKEFDFIWSSPPCPTHSRFNLPAQNKRYPDMKLYEEIVFLTWFSEAKWCVENVISYYEPLIRPYKLDGHYFWTNFFIPGNTEQRNFTNMDINEIAKERLINLDELIEKSDDYELLLRNCVVPKTGRYIFDCAFKVKQIKLGEVER